MSEPYTSPYVKIDGRSVLRSDIIALYDAGDVVEIIWKAMEQSGFMDPQPRVQVVSMTIAQVVSLLGTVPPIIHGHLARSVRR